MVWETVYPLLIFISADDRRGWQHTMDSYLSVQIYGYFVKNGYFVLLLQGGWWKWELVIDGRDWVLAYCIVIFFVPKECVLSRHVVSHHIGSCLIEFLCQDYFVTDFYTFL